MELHIDRVLERVEEDLDSGPNECNMSGSSSVSSSVEFLLDFNDTFEGCECKARARLSEAVDPLTCRRGVDVDAGVVIDERSTELDVTDVDSNPCC